MSNGPGVDNGNSEPLQSHPYPLHSFQMDNSAVLQAATDNNSMSQESVQNKGAMGGIARHTFGLILLLGVVFMWTASNFLGSSIFADDSYAKPFFVTYINSAVFIFAMIPTLLKETYLRYKAGTLRATLKQIFSMETLKYFWTNKNHTTKEQEDDNETEAFLKPDETLPGASLNIRAPNQTTDSQDENLLSKHLALIPTARLALVFCMLWFGANYFAVACLQYTTVASTTIISSTSSVWTLLIGAVSRIEKFTWRKLCGVLASVAGIVLISRVDLAAPPTGESVPSDHPSHLRLRAMDTFPDKTVGEVALGDALALLSAMIYGLYTITLKRTTLKAAPLSLDMPLFFAFVGIFNFVLFLPFFPILHFTKIETFELPSTAHVWYILLFMSLVSFLSDIMWAYAMVFTSPLVVTVGLSLTIPVSLVGEMIIQGRYEGWVYWVGAMIVVGSFVFVDREEVKEGILEEEERDERRSLVLEDGLMRSMSVDGGARSHSQDAGHLLDDDDSDEDEDEDDRRRDRLQRQADGYQDLNR